MQFILGFFIVLSFLTPTYGASYLGLRTGDSSQEVDSFDRLGDEVKEKVGGSVFGLDLGYFLTNSLAIEVGYTDVKQESLSVSSTSPIPFSYESNGELSIINLGFRWFLADFLNLRFGGTKTEYNPRIQADGALSGLESKAIEDRSSYYGVGLGYTMRQIQLFYDYTVFPNEDGENMKMTTFGIRLFLIDGQ